MLRLPIFVPQTVRTSSTVKPSTCAISVAERAIGQTTAHQEINLQDLSLELTETFEIEQESWNVIESLVVRGKLRSKLRFWRDCVQASPFVLDIIENGYKLNFFETPHQYSIENRSSAFRHK